MAVQSITAQQLISFLKLPEGTTVTMEGPPTALALSTGYLAHFDGKPDNPFFIMSTGQALTVTGPNTGQDQGYDYDPAGLPDGDQLTITFLIPKPVSATNVTFDFAFLSEEYPEYVGDAYDDFFSVKINGVEAALDTNGKKISVNNNFFNGALTPTGTFFDGQTPALKITAPVDVNAPAVEIKLTIADVADGIYDSAAFIRNIGFIEPQYVFIDFDSGNMLPFHSVGGIHKGFKLPGSGLSSSQKDTIMTLLEQTYDQFLIEFHTFKPTDPARQFSTIHVGGKVADLPFWVEVPESGTLFGRAQDIDLGNANKSDSAFVLAGELSGDTVLIAQTIAHELGHLLGLRHVIDENEMMYPLVIYTAHEIGPEELLGELDKNNNVIEVGGTQDTFEELARNVGLKDSATLQVRESSLKAVTKFFNFSANSTLPKIYDVKIVVATADNEIIQVINAGTINGKGSTDMMLPAVESDKIIIIGKSKANGKFDVFVTPTGVKKIDLSKTGDIKLLEKLGVDVSEVDVGKSALMQAGKGGALTKVGTMQAIVVDIGAAADGASPGPDKLNGSNDKNDTLAGLGGDDSINGFDKNDILLGNEGDDTVRGGLGKDTLDGGTGNDLLTGGLDADVIRGGAGNDTADYSDSNSLVVNLADPRKNTNFAKGDKFDSIENVFGSNAVLGDALTGNAKKNILVGGVGFDTLDGGDGNDSLDGGIDSDWLMGGAGKDTLEGGEGGDTLDGGAGRGDIASYLRASAGVTVNLGNPGANKGDAEGDTYRGIEDVRGSEYGDTLIGDEKDNTLFGFGGKDTITSGGGKDFLGGGDDDDSLEAGAGDDTLTGQAGKDTMRGGSGKDMFMFTHTGDADADVIEDFKPSDDTILLVAEFFDGLKPGPLPQSAFRSNGTGQAEDADDRIIYDKATGKIYFDPDGNGTAPRELIVTVEENLKGVTYEDFIVR